MSVFGRIIHFYVQATLRNCMWTCILIDVRMLLFNESVSKTLSNIMSKRCWHSIEPEGPWESASRSQQRKATMDEQAKEKLLAIVVKVQQAAAWVKKQLRRTRRDASRLFNPKVICTSLLFYLQRYSSGVACMCVCVCGRVWVCLCQIIYRMGVRGEEKLCIVGTRWSLLTFSKLKWWIFVFRCLRVHRSVCVCCKTCEYRLNLLRKSEFACACAGRGRKGYSSTGGKRNRRYFPQWFGCQCTWAQIQNAF